MSDVRVDFRSDSSQVDRNISKIKSGLGTIGAAARGVGTALKSAFAPLIAIGAIVGGLAVFKDVLDMSGDLDDFSKATGASIKELAVLQEAFKLAGASSETLKKAILGLNERLANPSDAVLKTLNDLGLSFQELQGLSMDQKFSVINQAISGFADEATRATFATTLFGKAGREMLPLFADGGVIDEAKVSLGGLADTLNTYAPQLAKIGDAFENVAIKAAQFVAAFLGENADRLVEIAEAFIRIDLTKAGQNAGKILRDFIQISEIIVNSFSTGTLGSTLKDALTYGWLNFKPVFFNGMIQAANIFSQTLMKGLEATGLFKTAEGLNTAFDILTFGGDFFGGARGGETMKPFELSAEETKMLDALSKKLMVGKAADNQTEKRNQETFEKARQDAESRRSRATEQSRSMDVSSAIDTAKAMAAKLAENAAKLKETKGGSLMNMLFGSKDFGTTSLQRIGGASGLTGNALTETRETNNILRRIEQLLGKPAPVIGTSNQFATFAL
jgi:hypothetical protein